MIKKYEKIIAMMDDDSIDALAAVAQKVSKRRANIRRAALESLLSGGFERVEASGTVTADGREVLVADGVTIALRPEIHAARRDAAFEAAKKARPEPVPETKSVVGTESLSRLVCPKCGDALQHTSICPKCAAGKIGYRHRYTCVCGGVDLISKDKL